MAKKRRKVGKAVKKERKKLKVHKKEEKNKAKRERKQAMLLQKEKAESAQETALNILGDGVPKADDAGPGTTATASETVTKKRPRSESNTSTAAREEGEKSTEAPVLTEAEKEAQCAREIALKKLQKREKKAEERKRIQEINTARNLKR